MKLFILFCLPILLTTAARAEDKLRDCMSGFPEQVKFIDMSLMEFDFGARTFSPDQKCTSTFRPYVGSIRYTCFVCAEKSDSEARSVGKRKVIAITTEGGATVFKLENKNDNAITMKCNQPGDGKDNDSALAENPARSVLAALQKEGAITCHGLPIPKEAIRKDKGLAPVITN